MNKIYIQREREREREREKGTKEIDTHRKKERRVQKESILKK
jgi:hypothetical protein